MKKILIFIALSVLCCLLFAAKKSVSPEADVSWKKNGSKITYTITIKKPFKMNLEAPFKFQLKADDKKILKKVNLDEFTNNKKGVYTFTSNFKEKKLKYWFIACKYKNGKQVACKTFVGNKEI